MKFITFFALACLIISCRSMKTTSSTSGKLDGTWVPVKEEMGGTGLPAAGFSMQRLTIQDTTYTFVAESVDKGTVKYYDDKMDIYSKEGVNAGKHFRAIYKYENGELTVCYNLQGDDYPTAFDTKGKPMYFLCTFKRI